MTIIGCPTTTLYDFIGHWIPNEHGTFEWVDGPLVKALEGSTQEFTWGESLVIDRAERISPEVWEELAVAIPMLKAGIGGDLDKSAVVQRSCATVAARRVAEAGAEA